MTGPKQYVVEARTRANEHLVITFKLLYDWVRTRTLRQPAQLSGCSSSCDCDQALTYRSVFPLVRSSSIAIWSQRSRSLPFKTMRTASVPEQQKTPAWASKTRSAHMHDLTLSRAQ